MAFVLDASAALAWCFANEATAGTEALLDRLENREEAFVPPHWHLELGNAVLVAVRRQRLSYPDALGFLEDMECLNIRIDALPVPDIRLSIFPLATKWQLTLYDAAYLELAIRLGLPLATRDQQLETAARSAAVALMPL